MGTCSLMKLEKYILNQTNIGFVGVAVLLYSYDNNKWDTSREVFETCYNNVCWFSDWWEGQPHIKLIGLFNVYDYLIDSDSLRNEVFDNG